MTSVKRKHDFKRLGILYTIALLGIAGSVIVTQLFTQRYLRRQESDSRVVNLAGRQRMLSQQISKLALQLNTTADTQSRRKYAQQLQTALTDWQVSHEGLQHGSDSLGIRRENSAPVDTLFQQIAPAYRAMQAAARRLSQEAQLSETTTELQPYVDTILANEERFLVLMDEIVFRYDAEASARVVALRTIELLLLFASLAIISLELFFIFRPTVRRIRQTVGDLTASEQTAQSMAREMSVLYRSLEDSYQELATVHVQEVPPTVYAKTDQQGHFTHTSDGFHQVLEYDLSEKTSSLFDWLEQEGYAADHVRSIERLTIQHGELWNGEVKATSESGDFVWLRMSIIPTLDEAQEVAGLSIVCADQTERKEAEVRSREITHDRIEKKLKEQRFRSLLILEGQEEERRRISRDIHDGIGQLLTGLKLKIEAIDLAPDLPTRGSKVAAARSLLDHVIREVRRISFNLNPSALADYGLVPVTKRFCGQAAKLSEKNVVFENQTGFISRMDKKVETHLYRIIQEGVNNAIKYAQASEIRVVFNHNSQYLNVDIVDDGIGFQVSDAYPPPESTQGTGLGLFNVRERASFINGAFTIRSSPGEGTILNIHLPI